MIKKLFLFPVVLCILFSACKKDADQELVKLSDEEVVDTIEASLKSSDGGATMNVEDVAKISDDYLLPECGVTNDTTLTVSSPQDKYSITSNWTWAVNCEGVIPIPTDINFSLIGSSEYNGNKLNMDATLTGDLVVSNLISGTEYIINGTLTRKGNTTISTRADEKTYNSNISITLSNLNIDKENNNITSGTGNVSFDGTVNNGSAFDRTGSLTFNGNGTATLVLDNGNIYTLNI